jgi:hypothetical protein
MEVLDPSFTVKNEEVYYSWYSLLESSEYQLCSTFPYLRSFSSTSNCEPFDKLNPNWVTGFFDGDGAFMINVDHSKTKLRLNPYISLQVHKRDTAILNR